MQFYHVFMLVNLKGNLIREKKEWTPYTLQMRKNRVIDILHRHNVHFLNLA